MRYLLKNNSTGLYFHSFSRRTCYLVWREKSKAKLFQNISGIKNCVAIYPYRLSGGGRSFEDTLLHFNYSIEEVTF